MTTKIPGGNATEGVRQSQNTQPDIEAVGQLDGPMLGAITDYWHRRFVPDETTALRELPAGKYETGFLRREYTSGRDVPVFRVPGTDRFYFGGTEDGRKVFYGPVEGLRTGHDGLAQAFRRDLGVVRMNSGIGWD
jgi:hypothetical protein